MHISELSVVNYKNITEARLQLSSKLNCFIGNNGVGKTNLLDCIYYLSFCRSYFNASDIYNIKHGEEFFILQGRYMKGEDGEEEVHCGLKRGQRKRFRRNKKEYQRLLEHIGVLPLVMVSPSDVQLILGGSEERRKFMDNVISQSDRTYLSWLVRYNRAVLQRNSLLKHFAKNHVFDAAGLEVWDEQLVAFGEKIYKKRTEFLSDLLPVFQKYYQLVSKGGEEVSLKYLSQLESGGFRDMLREALPKDRILQYTSTGVHKDDLDLKLGGYPIKKLGSQGQKKTYLISLKLAQFEFISSVSGAKPILLLDDIFDKLDSERVEQIVSLVSGNTFGQIFITDTNREHLDSIISSSLDDYKIFNVTGSGVVSG